MKIGINQPYLFPYIGYFQLINAVDKFIIYDDVNYIKGGWINRNRILINNQQHYFTIPLCEASQNKKINEINIICDKHYLLNMIYYAYKKATYYSKVFPLIEKIINYKENNLAKYISNSIIEIINYLDINTNIIISSDKIIGDKLKGKCRTIALCQYYNACTYYNSIGGINLYDKNDFHKHGIELRFIKPKEVVYKQFDNEFIPNLSIIDVMMFNSLEQIKELLNKFELI